MREIEILDKMINDCWAIVSKEGRKEYEFHINNLKKYLQINSDDYKAFIESEMNNEGI
tara:strand:- start:914 stop:1087 length:174 start_codon:yes stop_codon:yes gene_type:complete